MDFLDPKRKKAHRRRLLIGYILIAVAVAMGTLILLFSAYGYDIDRKTGEVIQNGIVFVDSKPGGATVYINGQQNGSTATRLVLPSGTYTVRLDEDGYRTWTRTLQLAGGSIERLVYPLLVPTVLKPVDVQLYATAPGMATTSPDRHWLLAQQPGQTTVFDSYDLTKPTTPPVPLQIPDTIMTEPDKTVALTMVDWSNDNKHVLFDRTYADNKHEFIMFNRDEPSTSLNLNAVFGVPITSLQLRNKKPDQFYLYSADGGVLRSADSKARTVSGPLASGVLSFKSYNDNMLFYVTTTGAPSGKVRAQIMENDKVYSLRDLPTGGSYLLDFAEYTGHWYYAIGATNEDNVFVYRDPLDALKNPSKPVPSIAAILRLAAPKSVAFSANTRFIGVQSGNKFVTYDAESDGQYKFTVAQPVEGANIAKWMDGYRYSYVHGGEAYIVDFDGSNPQDMGKVSGPLDGPFFDRDYTNMFTVSPSVTVPSRAALVETSLIKAK